ncbi:MAG: VWA domain-containing protein [Verrucomicrobiales bacterium]|nr:VWA domain-containing protein [Verrucomicrobiales bacterium]
MKLTKCLITTLTMLSLSVPTLYAEDTAKKITKPKIEVCFVLDTTGSMGGLIQGAKEKIWSIANEIVDADPTPELKIGLVGYRDRGDQYITKQFPLTDDIDAIYGDLLGFRAGGGGDGPESVNQALHEAVTDMKWSKSKEVLKIIFLVGDAPPHMDYQDDVKYPEVCQLAMKNDLIINTIQCGNNRSATGIWQEIASKSEGDYAAILQSGGTIAISTPFDDEIAALNSRLNHTVLAYGSEEARASVRMKVSNNSVASAETVASRAGYLSKQKMAGAAFAKQVSGDNDLIALLAENKISKDNIEVEKLPEKAKEMSVEERNAWIDTQLEERKQAQTNLTELLKKRDAFVKVEKDKLAKAGKGDGFDEQVSKSLRAQAAKKGIFYK